MSKSKRRTISGRTVVITGAASGIGRALAQRLSAHSCPVAIADIDEKGLKGTEASLHGPALLRVLDVSDADAQRDFAGEVRDWAPRPIGAVFNNAGVATASSVLDSVPEDDDWLWNINFHGVVNGTRAFLPILVEQNEGAIVNTSSVFGLVGMPNQSAYCSAKFAVRGFTDSLRQELRGTGVTAINVHPGGINTNIVRNARWRKDPEGRGRSQEQMVQEFAAITMTQPDKAAEIIHRGVEQGKARILVGPDAYLFDTLGRLAPTRYYDVLGQLQSFLRRRSQANTASEVTATAAAHLPPGPRWPLPSKASVVRRFFGSADSVTRPCAQLSSPSTATCRSYRCRSGRTRRPRRQARYASRCAPPASTLPTISPGSASIPTHRSRQPSSATKWPGPSRP